MTIENNKLSHMAQDQAFWSKRKKNITFGKTIRAYRLAEEWSLTNTAEKIGISKQQLGDYESGRKLPSIEKAYQIAKALGMMPQGVVLQVINEQLHKSKIPIQVELAS
jgi:transcriptional regulator with XRE-family HTH domain